MHSRIFQIETKEMGEDEFIKSCFFDYDEISHFADYVDDDRVNVEDDLKRLDVDFKGIFKRDGRKLTLLNTNAFVDEWKQEIKRRADVIDITDWQSMYYLKAVLRETHRYSDYKIYCDYGGIMDFASYVSHLVSEHKPGDVFYVGGIVDYHF